MMMLILAKNNTNMRILWDLLFGALGFSNTPKCWLSDTTICIPVVLYVLALLPVAGLDQILTKKHSSLFGRLHFQAFPVSHNFCYFSHLLE